MCLCRFMQSKNSKCKKHVNFQYKERTSSLFIDKIKSVKYYNRTTNNLFYQLIKLDALIF
uniref:Uncharacterized protein n=1 Tax=Rhizophora mucronata TaxID=61149 RepID=A0A2P2IN09_RHIMU